MPYRKQIEKIIEISCEINAFREKREIKSGVTDGLEIGSDAAQEYLRNVQDATKPLISYLNTLTTTDLENLVVLMYAGSERNSLHEYNSYDDFYNTITKSCRITDNKSACIEKIVEKLPALKTYYNDALEENFCNPII